jgi:hypothetical protein
MFQAENVEPTRGQTLLDFQNGGFHRNGGGTVVFAGRPAVGSRANKNAAQQETR